MHTCSIWVYHVLRPRHFHPPRTSPHAPLHYLPSSPMALRSCSYEHGAATPWEYKFRDCTFSIPILTKSPLGALSHERETAFPDLNLRISLMATNLPLGSTPPLQTAAPHSSSFKSIFYNPLVPMSVPYCITNQTIESKPYSLHKILLGSQEIVY